MNFGDAATADGTAGVGVFFSSSDPDSRISPFEIDVGTTQLELSSQGPTMELRYRF